MLYTFYAEVWIDEEKRVAYLLKKSYNNSNEVDISIERKIGKEMNKERNLIINQVTFDSKIY